MRLSLNSTNRSRRRSTTTIIRRVTTSSAIELVCRVSASRVNARGRHDRAFTVGIYILCALATKDDEQSDAQQHFASKKRSQRNAPSAPIINIVPAKPNVTECEPPAYLQFPPDIFGQWLRSHGFVIVHFGVVCYMFYCLAVVCDNYFLPSLEECAKVRTVQTSIFNNYLPSERARG